MPRKKQQKNPLPPALTSSIIEGAGFAAGTAMAMPIIEGGKQLFKKGKKMVAKGMGIRNPEGHYQYSSGLTLADAQKLKRKLETEDKKLRKLGGNGNWAEVIVEKTFERPSGRNEYGVFVRPKNPGSLSQAEDLSESFHGRPVESDYYATDELQYDANLSDLGALTELSLWTGKKGYDLPINFTRPYPRLASSADGQQLYIVGGDQSLDNASFTALKKSPVYAQAVGDNRSKRKIPLGTLVTVVYKADKHHLKGASGGVDTWEHHFGEDSRKQPMLVYDTLNRKMEIVGGNYRVEDVGIVD